MIIIIAPAERYTPPPILLSWCLIERTSFRKFFFSDGFKFDLSIALISSNLSSKVLASADSAGFEVTGEEDAAVVAAIDKIGQNVNDKNVTIKQRAIFFMLFDF